MNDKLKKKNYLKKDNKKMGDEYEKPHDKQETDIKERGEN